MNQVDEITQVRAPAGIEAGQFDSTRELRLVDAERMAKGRGGVVAGEVLATTYLLLGVVEIMAGGDVAQAKRHFRRALCRPAHSAWRHDLRAHAGVVSAFDAVKAAARWSTRSASACRRLSSSFCRRHAEVEPARADRGLR